MKALLIRLLILPEGLIALTSVCLLVLLLCHLPQNLLINKSNGGGTFPGQRRGGGSHWIVPADQLG
ncbi:MAG TPA: hypothetical protein V6D06_19355 [Trichocoleus sp.]